MFQLNRELRKRYIKLSGDNRVKLRDMIDKRFVENVSLEQAYQEAFQYLEELETAKKPKSKKEKIKTPKKMKETKAVEPPQPQANVPPNEEDENPEIKEEDEKEIVRREHTKKIKNRSGLVFVSKRRLKKSKEALEKQEVKMEEKAEEAPKVVKKPIPIRSPPPVLSPTKASPKHNFSPFQTETVESQPKSKASDRYKTLIQTGATLKFYNDSAELKELLDFADRFANDPSFAPFMDLLGSCINNVSTAEKLKSFGGKQIWQTQSPMYWSGFRKKAKSLQ